MLTVSLSAYGLDAWLLGDPGEAIDQLEESRRVLERCDRNPQTVAYAAMALRNLGMVARSQGDYARAVERFRESAIQARVGIATGGYNVARGLCHLGRTVFPQGDVAQAKQLFNEALGVMQTEQLAGHTLADCLDWLVGRQRVLFLSSCSTATNAIGCSRNPATATHQRGSAAGMRRCHSAVR